MKIAWLTPLAPGSAIGGRFTAPVVRALREHAQVDLWHPASSAPGDVDARVLAGEASHAALAEYDLVVHNIGNHAGNHADIVASAAAVPGVVILHDLVLHHLFYELHRPAPERYLDLVARCCGAAAARRAAAAERGEQQPVVASPEVVEQPLFEAALGDAFAVVVHSSAAARAVERRFLGPVLALQLPYDPVPHGERPPSTADDRLELLTVGHVNPNKRVDLVVEALGSDSQLRERVRYRVCGPVEPRPRRMLEERAQVLGVDLVLEGPVSDARLAAALDAADAAVVLRHPWFETGSASLVEALHRGLPVVVHEDGPYADVPRDCGVRVPPTATPQQLASALRPLVLDDDLRRRCGAAARAHATRAHDPVAYAGGLLALAARRGEERPLRELGARLRAALTSVGLDPAGGCGRAASSLAAELFSPRPSR